MKSITLILALIFISSTAAFAQKRSDLTGPAYKNQKPWKNNSKTTNLYAETNKEQLKGPAYKNQKPGETSSEATYAVVELGSERSKLDGHEYKNYKPWENKTRETAIETTKVYIASDD